MEPRIQYARTVDGVNIAYWLLGQGEDVLYMPPMPWSHAEGDWRDPGFHDWFERLVDGGIRLLKYDTRGTGLSDREVVDLSPEACLLDIVAVADKVGMRQFTLVGVSPSTPLAIMFAARHPERVTRLVLWAARSTPMDFARDSRIQVFEDLMKGDWHLFTQTIAHALVAGWGASEAAGRFAALMRESVDQKTALRLFEAWSAFRLTDFLPNVKCPTLVLQPRDLTSPTVKDAQSIAAAIPDAQLALVDGGAHLPWLNDLHAVLSAIFQFVGLPALERPAEPVAAPASAAMATILFTDMESSTGLTQRVGDERAQEVVRAHNTVVRNVVRRRGGTEVKHTGDGIMASFTLASSAIQAAIDIQRDAEAYRSEHPDAPFRVRIGLNAGEPVSEEEDLYGTAVQLAARVCAQAQPDQVLVSDVVRQLAAGKGFLFADMGDTALRGFEDPVRLYEVRWQA